MAEMLLSTKTMSWSLTPGTGFHFWISEGLFVMKTSSVFLSLVGNFTIWSDPLSYTVSKTVDLGCWDCCDH